MRVRCGNQLKTMRQLCSRCSWRVSRLASGSMPSGTANQGVLLAISYAQQSGECNRPPLPASPTAMRNRMGQGWHLQPTANIRIRHLASDAVAGGQQLCVSSARLLKTAVHMQRRCVC